MASIISAGTTSSTALNISGDTSGNLAFQTQAGANTITIANQTGTLHAAGPAFSVALAGIQTIGASVTTKLVWDTEEYDTNNNFASSRFTPTVAGYYQLNWSIYNSTASVNQNISVYKNGSFYKMTSYMPSTTSTWLMFSSGILIYMNGTTDYVELYASYQTGGVVGNNAGTAFNWFQGFLARGA
jgi:hypothetical protein